MNNYVEYVMEIYKTKVVLVVVIYFVGNAY